MKKKNNKGFFLAETIVVVALITIVMAFVYPNVAHLYDNYDKRANYYDQIQDLYALEAIYNARSNQFCKVASSVTGANSKQTVDANININDVDALYLTKYITSATDDDYEFNKYLSRLRKTTFDNKAYRLIGIFKGEDENGNEKKPRYASIKIYLEGCK